MRVDRIVTQPRLVGPRLRAAQQADAVAEAIAASVGVEIDPQPFRPILRGVLLTGGRERYLRADISGG